MKSFLALLLLAVLTANTQAQDNDYISGLGKGMKYALEGDSAMYNIQRECFEGMDCFETLRGMSDGREKIQELNSAQGEARRIKKAEIEYIVDTEFIGTDFKDLLYVQVTNLLSAY